MGNQQLLNEVWKDISNYEGCYQVSNYGRIKSVKRIVKSPRGVRTVNERILKLSIDKYGYKTLVLHKEGHKNDKHFTVHRIVALHFVNNPNNYPCVNHKDENKINNFYENLEWCTVDYNNKYNQRQEKINIKLRNMERGKKIKRTCLTTGNITIYSNLRRMERQTGLMRGPVSLQCRGLKKRPYRNCNWEFIQEFNDYPEMEYTQVSGNTEHPEMDGDIV